ncbi:hypothetical protein [Maribacter sp. HTCC2170]|uniref:hypothetical protein n=1 Tax=Maribacter sp. (strain HTCC2170 / KCCM 42371) TaxID=313603 RepID=UPI00006ADA60|nr:hypothetical protein [Maribacter sp. HTCC2170]EAQ99846.1 hypothetical protein FB2170_16031 [Maribacter sp. HTCC2170]
MQEDSQTKYDEFILKRIKEEGLEKPSLHFTNAVISKIEAQKVFNVEFDNKPLIPKYFWYTGAAIVVLLFSYLIYGKVDMGINWIPEERIEQLEHLRLLERLPSIDVSNSYVYAFIGLAFFVGVQVYMLKTHFDKRYFIN